MLNKSERNVTDAKTVLKIGGEELIADVDKGEVKDGGTEYLSAIAGR